MSTTMIMTSDPRAAALREWLAVTIYTRMGDGRWLWAGDGNLDGGRIVDCAADLPEAAYDALDAAIDGPGSYTAQVDGVEYRADATVREA